MNTSRRNLVLLMWTAALAAFGFVLWLCTYESAQPDAAMLAPHVESSQAATDGTARAQLEGAPLVEPTPDPQSVQSSRSAAQRTVAAQAPTSFEEKYAGYTPEEMRRAHAELTTRLVEIDKRLLKERFVKGETRLDRAQPSDNVQTSPGFTATASRTSARPGEVIESKIGDLDETKHPETRDLLAEIQWLGARMSGYK